MKRRITSVFLSALLIFCFFSVNVYAANGEECVSPPNTIFNNETGEIGTLITSKLDAGGKKFMEDYLNGNGEFIITSNKDNKYNFTRFYILKINSGIPICKLSNGILHFYIDSSFSVSLLSFMSGGGSLYEGVPLENYLHVNDKIYNSKYVDESLVQCGNVVLDNSLFFKNYNISMDYTWKPIKNGTVKNPIIKCDDIETPKPPEPPPPPPPEPEPKPEPPSKPIVKPVARSSGNWYDWIVNIFVPADNYFNNKIAEINNNINKKLGGISYLYQYINSFFKTLQAPPGDKIISVTIPDNFLFKGYKGTSANLFAGATPFIRIVKAVTTSFLLVVTGISCYKKLIKLFEQ